MPELISVPVLFVSEPIVLPGMVVPIELDEAARPRSTPPSASGDGKLLLAPRLDDRYPTYGVVATIVRSVSAGERRRRRAVLRAGAAPASAAGVTGPGAALWVEVEPVERDRDRPRPRARRGVQAAGRRRSSSAARPGRSSTRSTR